MPPIRNITPGPVNKTERSHAENQERAYIAASRRSDRSLEARVESARRASEIHKRRTGRSLRVTEEDVLNEEMYEEEDDDLPRHYQRLAAQFYTGSTHFNARLASYLADQVVMQNVVAASVNQNAHAHRYPLGSHHGHYHVNSMQSPIMASSAQPLYSPVSPSSAQFQAMSTQNGSNPPISHSNPPNIPHPQPILYTPVLTPLSSIPHHDASNPPPPVRPPSTQPEPSYDTQVESASFLPQPQNHPGFGDQFNPFGTGLPQTAQHFYRPFLDLANISPISPSNYTQYSWGVSSMSAHLGPPSPQTTFSNPLSPPPSTAAVTATVTATAPSDFTGPTHEANVQDDNENPSENSENKSKDNPASIIGGDDDYSGQESKHKLFIAATSPSSSTTIPTTASSSWPRKPLPQNRSSSSLSEKSFQSKEIPSSVTQPCALDLEQNAPYADAFWDRFFHDATWYHHDEHIFAPNVNIT